MKWYLVVLKNYAGFSGRARRKEYWMFALFNAIFTVVATILDNVLGTTIEGLQSDHDLFGYGICYLIYNLAVFLPTTAVIVRRLHDIGKSSWMVLLILIPYAVSTLNDLAVFLPDIAVVVRILHDIGEIGWMLLIVLPLLVLIIWFIILMATNGDPEENQYGPNPKGVIA